MGYERKPRRKLSPEELAKVRAKREQEDKERHLGAWVPKTKIGRLVRAKKIENIDKVIDEKILEAEIVDSLLNLKSDVLNIGQAKGKFGGGKRRAWRQTQKKTKEGNVATFSCMTVVGDGNGHIGLGYGKAKKLFLQDQRL